MTTDWRRASRVMSDAAKLIDLQSPVVAAACRWVAADAAEKAARAAYDLANDEPYSPERGPTMSNAVAAMRAAWTEQRAAAAERLESWSALRSAQAGQAMRARFGATVARTPATA